MNTALDTPQNSNAKFHHPQTTFEILQEREREQEHREEGREKKPLIVATIICL
jgi:hypothetical protein